MLVLTEADKKRWHSDYQIQLLNEYFKMVSIIIA